MKLKELIQALLKNEKVIVKVAALVLGAGITGILGLAGIAPAPVVKELCENAPAAVAKSEEKSEPKFEAAPAPENPKPLEEK